jgi:hypothetical protein
MRKLIIVLILICLVYGCQKIFKDDPQNVYAINSENELADALSILYYKVSSTMTYPSSLFIFGNSDDIIPSTNNGITSDLLYTSLYSAISCSNDLLKHSEGLKKNKRVINLLGEVYFIRAWCYYNLARCYGQPPLVYNTDFSYTVKKPSYTEVYDSVQNDLQRAINYLPGSFDESRIKYITPHRGTAKALMAEVLLTRGGYPANDKAAYSKSWQIAGEVIDSAAYYNYGLLPDFASLWDYKHEMNIEGEFALFYLCDGAPSQRGWVTDSIASLPRFNKVIKMQWFLTNGDIGIKFYNNYPTSYRKDKTYETYLKQLNGTDTIYIKKVNYQVETNYIMHLKKYYSFVDSLGYYFDYFMNINVGGISDGYCPYRGNVLYLMRYAHTLLTYAEAKARDGQLDVMAYEAVNKVRRRSHKVDINSSSVYDLTPNLTTRDFVDSVVFERALEFCGEPFNRWFDLLRTGNAGTIKVDAPNVSYQIPMNVNYFYDIPASEKLLNPGLN